MAFDTQSTINTLATPWLGYRFVLLSAKPSIDQQKIILADIAEVEFPEVTIEYLTVPTLSVRERKIPSRYTYGDLTLRSSVIRSPVFFQEIQRTIDVLKGIGNSSTASNDFVIALYGANSAIDALPIRIWLVKGAQPKSFRAPKASANEDGSMPLEELVFVVEDFRPL